MKTLDDQAFDLVNNSLRPLKTYSVLIQDGKNDRKIEIEARNENDARWAGRKMDGVYSATVLKRIK